MEASARGVPISIRSAVDARVAACRGAQGPSDRQVDRAKAAESKTNAVEDAVMQ